MTRASKFALCLIAGFLAGAGAIETLHAQSQKKPAYLVAEVEITDQPAFQAYQKKAGETLKPYQVRVLANGKADVKEGAAASGSTIILAFDSMADAQKWYGTSPYKELIADRQKAAKTRLYFVEGVPAP
jgi:uncharacterized protein (DUF1330 family)